LIEISEDLPPLNSLDLFESMKVCDLDLIGIINFLKRGLRVIIVSARSETRDTSEV